MYDAIKIGSFGFYKDSDLRYPLKEGELFDQMDSNGVINIWFGGKKLWLPEVGELDILAKCTQTFMWEILDENNKRTDEGLSSVFLSRAELVEPFYGDLIPLNPEEVFDIYKPELAKSEVDEIRASRLWFYNSLFKDQYYRYSIIAMPKTENTFNEIDANFLPRNNLIKVPHYNWLYGFRPKFEYYSKLAVLKKISTRKEGKMHFRIQVDMDYLAENPGIKRSIRMFSQTNDKVTMLVYQKDPKKIVWKNQRNQYKRDYLNYSIFNAIVIDFPSDGAFEQTEKKYWEYMRISNMILSMDTANYELLQKDIKSIINKEQRIYNGYSVLVMDEFFVWLKSNLKGEYITKNKTEILNMILLTKRYYKGFSILADSLGLISIQKPYSGPVIKHLLPDEYKTIVTSLGGKEFSDGVRMSKALKYIHNAESKYTYTGDIGNGYYWINGADEKDRRIWCNMDLDGGGWMLLFIESDNYNEYLRNTLNITKKSEEQFHYNLDKGCSFNMPDDSIIDIPWVRFNEISIDMYLELADTVITIYNANGLLAKYDCSGDDGVDVIYRGEESKRIPFGPITDSFSLPEEQKGVTITVKNSGTIIKRQYFKKIIAR